MSLNNISGKKAAFLVHNGFCEREFEQAERALKSLGVVCRTVSASSLDTINGWNEEKDPTESHWGQVYAVDDEISSASPADYDILVIPGGRRSIEKLSVSGSIRGFLSYFFKANRPVIVYNKAIELLTEYDLVKGRSLAAIDKVCDTAKNAGGRCAPPELVVSKNLITLSRYRSVEEKLKHAVVAVYNGERYVEKTVSGDAAGSAHKAA